MVSLRLRKDYKLFCWRIVSMFCSVWIIPTTGFSTDIEDSFPVHPINKALLKADSLVLRGNYENALYLLDSLENVADLSTISKAYLIKSKVYQVLEEWNAFQRCINISSQIKSSLGLSLEENYNQMVWYYQSVRRFDLAQEFGQKALDVAIKNNNLIEVAKAYSNIGYTFHYLKDHSKAQRYYDSALAVLNNHALYDDPVLARIYHNIGNGYNDRIGMRKDYLDSMNHYYNKSLFIYKMYGDPSKIALNYYVRGYGYLRMDEFEKAHDWMTQGMNLLTKGNKKINDREVPVLSETVNDNLFLIFLNRKYVLFITEYKATKEIEALEKAYGYITFHSLFYLNLLATKSDLGFDDLRYFASYDINTIPNLLETASLLADEKNNQRIFKKAYILAMLNKNAYAKVGNYQFNQHIKLINDAKYDDVLTSVQSQLNDEQAIIDFFNQETPFLYDKKQIYSVVITKSDFGIFKKDCDSNFYDGLAEFRNFTPLLQPQDFQKLSHAIFNSLVKDAINFSDEKTQIIICPDRNLDSVPFEALIYELKHTNDFRDFNYLINRYNIRYELSSDMPSQQQLEPISEVKIGFYNPDYSYSKYINLSFSKEIFNHVKNIFKTQYLNNLDSLDESINILHISSHMNSDEQDYLNTTILLPDGRIPLTKFLKKFNNNKLVVLHGCNSTKGEYFKGDGSFGIAKAMKSTGTEAVISSLWELDEMTSSYMLIDFYEFFSTGVSSSMAINQAKMQYLINANSSEEAHPYYWAGLISYSGDIQYTPKSSYFLLGSSLLLLLFFIRVVIKKVTI